MRSDHLGKSGCTLQVPGSPEASPTQLEGGSEDCKPTRGASSSSRSRLAQQTEIPSSPVVPRLRLPGSSDMMDDSLAHHNGSSPHTVHASAHSAERPGTRSRSARSARNNVHDVRRSLECTSEGGHGRGLDPDVDSLLLQLDDLDARSKALQMHEESHRDKVSVETVPPEEGQTEKATSVGHAVARQHPLESLPLGLASNGVSENRWPAARCRRDRRPPRSHAIAASKDALVRADAVSDAFWAAPHKSSQGLDYPLGLPTSSRRRSKTSSSCVSLPPLKPSASAPACLIHGGSWHSASRGH